MNDAEYFHLSEYLHILNRRMFQFFTVLVITISPFLLFITFATPKFESTLILVIDQEESRSPLTGERLSYDSYLTQSLTFKTHFELIESRAIMERVIQKLGLTRLDKENVKPAGIVRKIKRVLKLETDIATERKNASDRTGLNHLVESLQKKIITKNVKDTRLLKIIVRDSDPLLASDMATAVGKVYIDFDNAGRLEKPLKRLGLMQKQLGAVSPVSRFSESILSIKSISWKWHSIRTF